MNSIVSFFIGISLSLDAFSLSLSLGTLNETRKSFFILALIVGLFHFLMPTLGFIMGRIFTSFVHFNTHLLSSIIFAYIGIEMLKEYKSENSTNFKFNIPCYIVFAIGVSLDSFGVGFTIKNDIFLSAIIFSILSFTFTLIGLNLGKVLNKLFGKLAIIIGASVMFIVSIVNFVNLISFN